MSVGSIIGAIIGGIIGGIIGQGPGMLYGASLGFTLGMMIDPMTPDVPSSTTPDQSELIMSSEVGAPLCDLAGTAKITGHLLCYGAENTETQYNESSGGKGGGGGGEKTISGYKYYMSWALGIVAGPVDTLYAVYDTDDDVIWQGELNCPESGGKETITLDGLGSADFYFGTADQATNAGVAGIIDDSTLNTPYRNLCWCFLNNCYIGEYNRAPTLKFIVKKTPEYSFSVKNEIQTYDCNPMHVVWYILHDLVGLPEIWSNSADFATVASTLSDEGRGLSVLFSKQQSALSYLESINNHVDNIIRYGTDGQFHPKLIRDDYTVSELTLIDENVMLEEPTLSRGSWINTINEMKVQYSEIYERTFCCDSIDYNFYMPEDIDTIALGSSQIITVSGGCPPFSWESDIPELTWEESETTSRTNTLTFSSDEEVTSGSGKIYVTDSCGESTLNELGIDNMIVEWSEADAVYHSRFGFTSWLFKIYRDDDTTIRDAEGNITINSGLELDIWTFGGIYVWDGIDYSGGLPPIRGWGYEYWTYYSETGIWVYDDSGDYPEDWWKGTYDTNTGYFTIENMEKSVDDLYWAYYYCAEPTTIRNPGVNAAVSTAKIDGWYGVYITLTEEGNNQTLQIPTDRTAGRNYVVKVNSLDGDFSIIVNGFEISDGEHRGFTWNGEAWATSDIDFLYGIETQYPYKYKWEDFTQTADKIYKGIYSANIPYWETSEVYYSPEPVYVESQPDCDDFTGFTVVLPAAGENKFLFYAPFTVKRNLKTSLPYYKKYEVDDVQIGGYGYCNLTYDCASIEPKNGTMDLYESVTHLSSDGFLNISQDDIKNNPITVYSYEQSMPESIDTEVVSSIVTSNIKVDEWRFWYADDPPVGSTYWCDDGEAVLYFRTCSLPVESIVNPDFDYQD